jgi:NADPH:quinone reductase-like Zn-dependent oxidoreductase
MFMRGNYWEATQLPATLGYEASGVVTALGANVDSSWLNKSVSIIPAFSLNQYGTQGMDVIVPVHALAEYPSHLTPVEATSICMQYMTAYGALIETGRVTKGQFVLITAASSGAGLAAIQTVKAEGAVSIATTRTAAKRSELLALGADHVIVTNEEDLVTRVMDITSGAESRSFSMQSQVHCWTNWQRRPLLALPLFSMASLPDHGHRFRWFQLSKRL